MYQLHQKIALWKTRQLRHSPIIRVIDETLIRIITIEQTRVVGIADGKRFVLQREMWIEEHSLVHWQESLPLWNRVKRSGESRSHTELLVLGDAHGKPITPKGNVFLNEHTGCYEYYGIRGVVPALRRYGSFNKAA